MANLAKKFVSLGDIRGMPIEAIIKRVGAPSSISAMADGQLYQWLKTGIFSAYHYSINVDRERKATGFSHQYAKGLYRIRSGGR